LEEKSLLKLSMFCLIERDSFDRPADAIIHMIQQLILLLPIPPTSEKRQKEKRSQI
jgi:hypothetical protein